MSNPTPLTSTVYNASVLFELKQRLSADKLNNELFLLSLHHVQRMLITEFGQQFARRFEQQHPRTFYRLVKTTQTKITWRPPVTPLKLLEQIV
jgi:hypothetical protein